MEKLDQIICNSNDLQNIEDTLKEYDSLKAEVNTIYEQKGKAAMFRSKCRWIEEGERPTKYFFNLEKQNFKRKTITELRLEDDKIVSDENEILKSIEDFYGNLYKSKGSLSEAEFHQFTSELNLPKISDDERGMLEGLLSFEECKEALKCLYDNKSPGEDGFTVEFFKCFFNVIGSDLVESFNYAHEKGQLSISQKRGIITLIPKQDSDLLDLQNWRPITLLNTDYKIAAKALARRIEKVLPGIINSDQTGFIKGRYIGENIRLISDIMDYTKSENLPGILLSLDFTKAFDTLECPYINRVLDILNCREGVKRWISIFYANIETAVLNNGFATKWFKPSRGVRQGCPLSPYLFVLGVEILAAKIRQNSLVKGINLFGNEVKISQFADDTNLFCADVTSVENAFVTINNFGGLQLNVKKTKAVWLGKWSKNRSTPLQLTWTHDPVKILRIHFSYDEKQNNYHNFPIKIQTLQTNLDLCKSRNLTLFGMVLIIKSIGLSQLVYSASNLNVPIDFTNDTQKKLSSFLWKKKRTKSKENVYINITKREEFVC